MEYCPTCGMRRASSAVHLCSAEVIQAIRSGFGAVG
jgi:hypothetical protein